MESYCLSMREFLSLAGQETREWMTGYLKMLSVALQVMFEPAAVESFSRLARIWSV